MSSARNRQRIETALAKALPGSAVTGYAAGRANARLSSSATALILGFGLAFFLVAVLAGRLLIPGALLLLFFVGALKPFRGCAVTNSGVALLQTGAMHHRPTKVVTTVPLGCLLPPNITAVGARAVRVRVGPETVRLRRADYDRLVARVSQTTAGGPGAPVPTGWNV
ncbi:MAG TPA: hypothetical protein VEH82_03190 [Acidimicrobiales bacterium]|nr:hypothetical protein [Acidimicrobiales bacterium]